jgi:hypothetical protein
MKIEIQEEKSLAIIKKDVDDVENINGLKVNSQPTLENAKQIRSFAKDIAKKVEAEEKKITKPLNEALKSTRDLFRPYKERIEKVVDYLDSQMLSYNKKLKEEEVIKAKELEDKIAKGKISFEKASEKIVKIEEKQDNINIRKIPKVRILDKSKIPLEYMEPDEVEIKRAILAGNIIPGAEIYYEETITE